MVAEITEIQKNEAYRPLTTIGQIPKNNEFTQPQTNKHTDPTTHRPCPYQQAPSQNTKKRHTVLPTRHLHRHNRRHSSPYIQMPKLQSRTISAHTKRSIGIRQGLEVHQWWYCYVVWCFLHLLDSKARCANVSLFPSYSGAMSP